MLISFFRAIILYIIVIFLIKFMGKRQISELQTSELVVTFLISDIASLPMQNTSQPLVSGLIPIVVLVCCEIFVSLFMMKNKNFRRLICGNAIIIIQDGKILQKELYKLRMTVDELFEQLRQVDVFSIQDVAYAIIETNGKLSVLKKGENQPPDACSLGVTVPNTVFEALVISDGEINTFALSVCSLSQDWLDGVLTGKGLKPSDVYIMTANKNKKFNIIKKQ
ncbi:MAG: DUF421 domain-containing protein [Candidatus Improbicoccus devescovinae]|nr:MAG: DUF421 domain-containing protein [Candidatus Improbicoccus devescovinae]